MGLASDGGLLVPEVLPDVRDRLDEWRMDRNEIVHKLVRSDPGEPTLPVDEFLEKAKQCCETGEDLSKQVVNWNKREKRNAERSENAT